MGRKLLYYLLLVFSIVIFSENGFSQACPTSVSISVAEGRTICENTQVTFSTTTNGGTNLNYQWQINNSDVDDADNQPNFTTSSLQNNDEVRVVITSSDDTTCEITSQPIEMTVNSIREGSVTIQADTNPICPGETINFSIKSITEAGTNPTYDWRVNNSSVGSNSTLNTSLASGDQVQLFITSSNPCTDNFSSNQITISEKPASPDTPSEISGSTEVCPGVSETYSITPVNNAISYQWELPTGWSGSSSSTSITLTTGTNTGTIKVIAIGECGNTEQNITVSVEPGTPAQPVSINGNNSVCPNTSETYSIAAVNDATEYVWNFPSGWNITEQITTTPEISIQTGSSGSGNITVAARNSCGTSTTQNLAVNLDPGTPEVPGIITGATEVCPGTNETYSINAVNNTEEYIWNFPSSWGIQEQITSTPEISIQTGSSGSGDITVAARNSCGTSTAQNLPIQMKDGAPTDAGSISILYSNTNQVICPGDEIEFSVTGLAEAEEYIWTIPAGWNITGAETGNSIIVNAGNYGENGNVSVVPSNSCGQGSASTIAVSVDAPAPEIGTTEITGPAEVCSSETQLEYSIPVINHATSYEWSLPPGWVITSGENTNSIEVSASGNSGNIEVFAKNDCGESSVISKTINSTTAVPTKPLAISSNLPSTAICPPFNNVQFWIDEVQNTEEYLWTLPAGWEIINGAGTTNITVNITANSNYSINESVSVQAVNICGASESETLEGIAIDNYVVTDLGDDMTLCSITNVVTLNAYVAFGSNNAKLKIENLVTSSGTQIDTPNGKVDNFPFTYTPTPADISNGQVTFYLTTEKPGGACNAGEDEMTIFFREDPTATFVTENQDICENTATEITLQGTPDTRINYTENGTSKTVDLDENGDATINTGNLSTSTSFTLINATYLQEPSCDNPLSESHEITVNPVPSADLVYSQAAFCKDDSEIKAITLENPIGAIENGSFSAAPSGLNIDETSGAITPGSSDPGDYLITYTIPPTLGCESVELTTNVSITPVPQVSLSYEDTYFCSSEESSKTVTLNGNGNYENGTFSAGTGLQIDSETGEINPSTSNPGTYTVTYTTPEMAGCGNYDFNTEIIITEAPNPIIAYPATEICNSQTTAFEVELTGNDNIQGGTYSAEAGLEINASTGVINPQNSSPGTYTVTYTTPEINGCAPVTTETSLTITELPSAEISYNTPICASETELQQVTFSSTVGNYEDGTFTASPAGLSINEETGAINPAESNPGIYSLAYTIPGQGGCEAVILTTSITITEVPYATINYENAALCTSVEQDQPVTFVDTPAEYQNGTFSGSNGLAISEDGSINPATSTDGLHTVFYSIPAENSCEEVIISLEIEIFEKPQITSQPFNVGICATQPSELSVSAIGDDLNYQWYQNGTALSGATSATLNFSNTTSANAGEYYVVVTGAQSCSEVTSETVFLNVDEDIIIEEPVTEVPICGDGFSEVTMKFIAHANGSPLTFTWYKDNVAIDASSDSNITITTNPPDAEGKYEGTLEIINVTTAYNGDYYVEIQGPSEFTCATAVTNPFQLRLNEVPEKPTVENFEYCQFEEVPALTVINGENLTWYASETGDDAFSETPVPNTDEPGETVYWVTQTPDVCESERIAVSVNIKEKPAPPATTILIEYCEGETANALEALADGEADLNWYDEEENLLSTAPIPSTENAGTYFYYVSQSLEACESDKVTIEVKIHELPEITITPSDTLVCAASAVTLTAEGADTYIWYNEANEEIGSTASLEINPETTTTYKVIGTGTGDCSSEADITIEVDQPSDAGAISEATNVCIGNNSGEVSVADINGEVIRWEFSEDDGATWETIIQEESEISTTYSYENIITTTDFRAVVQNGVCEEAASEAVSIQVDEYPIGGELNFQGFDRLYTTCQDPEFLEDLILSGHTGQVVAWKYRTAQGSFQTIAGETETTLPAAVIGNLLGSETIIFQAEIINGACNEAVTSRTAILSVISSDIEPAPVSVSDDLICLGDEVTLTAESGYQSGDGIDDSGNFDNASIDQHGWRIINTQGVVENFETSASNIRPNVWKRVTPREFITANLSSPYNTSLQLFDHGLTDQNKGFAIVSGNNSSTMETNVFALDGMDSGILTFDQAYNLTPGASIEVLISTNGGAAGSYTQLYSNNDDPSSGNYTDFASGTPTTRPENKIEIDLGDYIGQNNLRIMFRFTGANDGDVWAVDNIILPDGPQDVGVLWEDTTNPETPLVIGTNFSEQWTPTEIGWNVSVITTTLEYTGGSCPTARNDEEIKVFVYDQYTTTVQAETGSCGDFSAVLSALVSSESQGEITSYPTADGYIGKWVVEGPENYEFSNINPDDVIDPINNPNAIFTSESQSPESYTITWVLESTEKDENGNLIENETCLPTYEPLGLVFEGCKALDFDGIDDYVDLGDTYTENYSLEAWIRPEALTGTIISGPNFEINIENLPSGINANSRWYHIAVSNNKIYIDGIEEESFNTGNSGTKALIGARWNDETASAENYFSGWIEEVRIWNTAITEDQIRFMMNQRLYDNGTQMGVEIPMDVPEGLSYTNLAGYYQLLADPLLVAMGTTPDLANTSVPGKLINMETLQENTAPLPYTSRVDGQNWATDNTWTHFDVWDAPNSNGINGNPIDWNIVRTSHDIDSGNKNITVLGLISETGTLDIFNPSGAHNETNSGQYLSISHYLKLDGIIDLTGESQLIQDIGSIVDGGSSGHLERDQQGTANSYNYNYWSFPVSAGASNTGGPIKSLLRDGTDSNNPKDISFAYSHTHADNYDYNAGSKRISTYWLFKFFGTANIYAEWKWIGENGQLNAGDGFTMKGTSGNVAISTPQNYVFRGLPNNGPVSGVSIGTDQNRLIGNPYPSAIDAKQFILDNLDKNTVTGATNTQNIFNGALYFWDHFGEENTHILREYVGGYATINLSGSVASATSSDERINDNNTTGTKKPGTFIPVGQGFFINTVLDPAIADGIAINGGTINFNNGQRAFVTEINSLDSQFLKPIYPSKSQKAVTTEDSRYKIRLNFTSPLGFQRQILVTADAYASNGFDLGYDALLIDDIPEDMFWLIQDNEFVIQAVSNFNSDQILPLGIKIKEEGELKIKIGGIENYPETLPVYLNDKLNDSVHDLRSGEYSVVSEPGIIKDRFEVVFRNKEELENPDKPLLSTSLDFGYNHDTRELKIDNPDLVAISEVLLFDLGGRLIQTYSNIPTQKEHTINIRSMHTSVYIIKLITETGNKNKKFIMD